MALGPISNLGAVAPQPVAPRRDLTDAQRAFFQAALGQAAPVAAIEPAPPPAVPAPEPPKAAASADAPKAAYRPGSLLDIRV